MFFNFSVLADLKGTYVSLATPSAGDAYAGNTLPNVATNFSFVTNGEVVIIDKNLMQMGSYLPYEPLELPLGEPCIVGAKVDSTYICIGGTNPLTANVISLVDGESVGLVAGDHLFVCEGQVGDHSQYAVVVKESAGTSSLVSTGASVVVKFTIG